MWEASLPLPLPDRCWPWLVCYSNSGIYPHLYREGTISCVEKAQLAYLVRKECPTDSFKNRLTIYPRQTGKVLASVVQPWLVNQKSQIGGDTEWCDAPGRWVGRHHPAPVCLTCSCPAAAASGWSNYTSSSFSFSSNSSNRNCRRNSSSLPHFIYWIRRRPLCSTVLVA